MSRIPTHQSYWPGRGKGKRRFAPQGVWRSSGTGPDVEPMVWLPGAPKSFPRPPLPSPSMDAPSEKKSRKKDEYYLAELAREFWGPHLLPSQRKFNSSLVEGIYQTLRNANFTYRPIMGLEYSQYLENYLWPHFTVERASPAYLMSIVVMVNEKKRERMPAWQSFQSRPENFPSFFHLILQACSTDLQEKYSMKERTMLLVFLVHSFNSLEVDLIREQIQRLVSLSIWTNLLPSRLHAELHAVPKLQKYWSVIQRRDRQADEKTKERSQREREFLSKITEQFLQVLDSIPAEGEVNEDAVSYCERFLELVTDLEAQLPTRRFFNTLLNDSHLVVCCYLSSLASREPEGHLFKQLLGRLKFYAGFEISDQTGSALTDHEMTDIHYNKITSLQRAAFKLFPDLRSFALSNVAGVDTREALMKHFGVLSQQTLHEIASYLHLAPSSPRNTFTRQLLLKILVSHHERRPSQLEAINALPLYPTEQILWDENIVPSEFYNGETCLALPKLNLQFLTLHDYLLRNFELFRLESTYEIREDVEDIVSRMKPWLTPEGNTEFSGWARMALPISSFTVIEVGKPNVGENCPSRVRADVNLELNVADTVRWEWEGLRKHDVCFLVTVRAQMRLHEQFDWSKPFVPQVGLTCVRGCEVEGMLDEEGKLIEEGPDAKPTFTGSSRTFRVWLDTNQYQQDMASVIKGGEDVYESFNVFMRRKPKENNFKAVLETIRDLMNAECVVPDWLHDVFLGYGDPAAAHYNRLSSPLRTLDFNDTFLSLDHLQASFPQYQVKCTTDDPSKQVPPFRLTFPEARPPQKRKHPGDQKEEEGEEKRTLVVEPYTIPNRGPYPYNQPKRNTVPFTSTQVEAIRAGMHPGLTLVVGPPGTGKTDVAVQTIANLYHNFPEQRTLLVTHSNQALNQLFEKIMALDIDERHLLRLGHGEEELETEKDFSRYGRVNFILALRMELLKEVERLQGSLGVHGDVAYTCETAGHFFLYQVIARWEEYASRVRTLANKPEGVAAIAESFPFTKYFANAPQPIFKGESFQQDWDIAEGCFRHIRKIFKQLEEFRAFELLRSGRDRINYLLVKEAKIIAMTCTHAALKRRDLVELAFKYDNVLMEEAAQILEVETFIPLMLQNPQDGYNRLKRVIMIGDHHQLPPVIKNMAFQRYSNMEQSMFTRFVRLGVPTIQLDAQGRARPSLCALYSWRYLTLGNLPHVTRWPEYTVANPGFCYDYQLINVEDFNGVGESEPTPYFYQNLGEAEYAVALFMFMRLQGYPPDKIAILTTYNGQKHLIRDVLAKRCARNPVFGLPEKVTTVDRYQGQQNDYIILSLVRTKHVGHLRDVRRLVVAMSRARLGLYILARISLFRSCTELQPAFKLLMKRPAQLHLIPDEFYPATRHYNKPPTSQLFVVSNMQQLAQYVYQDYHCRIDALREQRNREKQSADSTEVMAPPPVETTPSLREVREEHGKQEEGSKEEAGQNEGTREEGEMQEGEEREQNEDTQEGGKMQEGEEERGQNEDTREGEERGQNEDTQEGEERGQNEATQEGGEVQEEVEEKAEWGGGDAGGSEEPASASDSPEEEGQMETD